MKKRPNRINLLVVDNESGFFERLFRGIRRTGHRLTRAMSGQQCLCFLRREDVDVVILNTRMAGMDTLDVLGHIRKYYPLVEVLLLHDNGDSRKAVDGMRQGAFDILDPTASPCELTETLSAAATRKREREQRIAAVPKRLIACW